MLHVSLESLEILGDPRFLPGSQEFLDHAKAQPPPFRRLAVVRSTRFLGPVALDEIFGSPFIAIVRRPNSIMFKDLDGGAVSTITCMPADGVVANCVSTRGRTTCECILTEPLLAALCGSHPSLTHAEPSLHRS